MAHPALRVGTAALATWRVTHLLAREDGPGDVVLRGRAALGTSRLGGLMDCFDCMSLWVAAPFAPFAARGSASERVTCWLALSGAACLLDRIAQGGTNTNWEDDDGLLWQGARGAPGVDARGGAGSGAGAGTAGEAPEGAGAGGGPNLAADGTGPGGRAAGGTAYAARSRPLRSEA